MDAEGEGSTSTDARDSSTSTLHSLFSSLATPGKLSSPAQRALAQPPIARDSSLILDGKTKNAMANKIRARHDEACYIDCAEKVDILAKAPVEIAAYILTFVDDYKHILAASEVSKTWRRYARDSRLWQQLFADRASYAGWQLSPLADTLWPKLDEAYENNWQRETVALERKNVGLRLQDLLQAEAAGSKRTLTEDGITGDNVKQFHGPMDWYSMYVARQALTKRWGLKDELPTADTGVEELTEEYDRLLDGSTDESHDEYRNDPAAQAYVRSQSRVTKPQPICEPDLRRLSGHDDSIYCVRLESSVTPSISLTESDRNRSMKRISLGLGTRGRIYTGSRDRTIKIWDGDTEQLLHTLDGHRGSVLCLELDNGQTLLSGSSDQTVRVWSLTPMLSNDPPALVKTLRGHCAGVLDLAMTQRWLISCGKDATVRVYDRANDYQCVRIYTQHRGPVNAGSLNTYDDATCAVTASGEGSIQLWQIETGSLLRSFEGHSKGLACVKFVDNVVISGSNDFSIRIWDAHSGRCLAVCVDHRDLVRALAYDRGRKVLVSAGYDGHVKLFDVRRIIEAASNSSEAPKEPFALTAVADLRPKPREDRHSRVFDVQIDATRIISCGESTSLSIRDFARDSPIMRLFV